MLREGAGIKWLVEVPLLFEKSLENWFDFTVCVACDPSSQLARLEQRGLDRALAGQRISKQLPLARKIELSDFVLWNDGSTGFLKSQVDRIVDSLNQAKAGAPFKENPDVPSSQDRRRKSPPPTRASKPAKRGRPRTRKAAPAVAAARRPEPEIFVPEARPEPAPAPVAPRPPNRRRSRSRTAAPAPMPRAMWAARSRRAETMAARPTAGRTTAGQGGGHGEWQDRNSWKRNKRKRGRHGGGPWQPGPGPGGGAPRYPQQPPPPRAPRCTGTCPIPARFADLAGARRAGRGDLLGQGRAALPGPPLLRSTWPT